MDKVTAFANKDNASRLATAKSDTQASSYSARANASRLSLASGDSTATPYSGRVNASRLTTVKTDAFVRNASLFSRLGGERVVSSIVRGFYGKALVDPRIKKYFDLDTAQEMEAQIQSQIAFLSAALGGPVFEGMDMRKAREHLATLGLNATHFDAVAEHLGAVLRGQNTPPPLMDEMEQFCAGLRANVLD
ncbi:MAG: group 1 truncated hemoglobin [Methylobacillus sp.]|jgi:hemoglobin|nr:group 1 truncated hemoglobin [Methylobacillus sp.]